MPFTYLCARHCLYASRRHERFAFFQRVSCDMQIAKKFAASPLRPGSPGGHT